MSEGFRRIAVLLLLVVGVQFWLVIGRGEYGTSPTVWVMAPLIVVASLPPVFRRTTRAIDRLRHFSPRGRAVGASVVFVAATAFFIWAGAFQGRQPFPKIHDEYMHMLQVRMLSHGRLWMPQHPCADSFESFHIFVKPVYASIYFPGTALLYLPIVWLKLHYWLMPAMVAGACAMTLFLIVDELMDGVYATLAVLLLGSLTQFRAVSLVVISHSVMVLLGLLIIWAWLRWKDRRSLAWAAVIGLIGGWAAITRPVDALCYALPIGANMLWTLRRRPPREIVATVGLIVACATPFLALQLVFNRGVTGSFFETPYHRYCELFTPQMTFGFHRYDPTARPQTTLLQRIKYYRGFTVSAAQEHQPERLRKTWTQERFPRIARYALPCELLLIAFPAGLLGVRGRRWIFPALIALSVAFYVFFAYLLPHYVVLVAPAVIVVTLIGVETICEASPRTRTWLVTLTAAIIVAFALRAMPQFNRLMRDDPYVFQSIAFDHRVPEMVKTPAIVLYHFNPEDNEHEDPVYNLDVLWPDHAPIIRAQDRDAATNLALFRYYAQRQPDRVVYRVDRTALSQGDYRPEELGRVSDLAARGYNPGTTTKP